MAGGPERGRGGGILGGMSENQANGAPDVRTDAAPQPPATVGFGPNGGAARGEMPWSYRHGVGLAVAVTVISAFLVAFVGTLVHRAGLRSDIPLGLVLALLIVILSAWSSRMRLGVWGLVLHFVVSAGVLWLLSSSYGGRTYLMVDGSSIFPTWIGANASYVWMYGMWLVQMVMIALPGRWFIMPPREQAGRDSGGADAESAGTADDAKDGNPAGEAGRKEEEQ